MYTLLKKIDCRATMKAEFLMVRGSGTSQPGTDNKTTFQKGEAHEQTRQTKEKRTRSYIFTRTTKKEA
jgi:hypothetical protein